MYINFALFCPTLIIRGFSVPYTSWSAMSWEMATMSVSTDLFLSFSSSTFFFFLSPNGEGYEKIE